MPGLPNAQDTAHAIDFLAYIVSRGCQAIAATYTILIKGIANEGFTEEVLELLNELYARGFMKKNSAKQLMVKIIYGSRL